MVQTNLYIIGKQCMKNELLGKSYHEEIWNREFTWDKNRLSQIDRVICVHRLICKDPVRELINKINNGDAAEPRELNLEMVNIAGEAGIDIKANLLNYAF